MSVVSNQNLSYFSTKNNVVSASSLGDVLSRNPALVEQSVFISKISIPNLITFSQSSETYEIRVNDIVSAITNCCIMNCLTSSQININFGMGAVELIQLLNLSDRNPFVDLKFKTSTDNTSYMVGMYITNVNSVGITVSGNILFASVNNRLNALRVIWETDTSVILTCGTPTGF